MSDNETITETIATEAPVEETTEETKQESEALRRFRRRINAKRILFDFSDFALLITQTAVLIVAVLSTIPFLLSLFLGYGFNTVLSGSMTGTVAVGEVVISKPFMGEELPQGTVVGIDSGTAKYVHRIVSVNRDDNGNFLNYSTQGDANSTRDLLKPTGEQVWGVAVGYIHAPFATALTLFALNTDWLASFGKALAGWDFTAMGELLPAAPWGFLGLVLAVLVFWWLIPDLATYLRNRAGAKDAIALEVLKEAVFSHDEALEELEPVVEELRAEHEAVKAEREEEATLRINQQQSVLDALGTFDPYNLYGEDDTDTDTEVVEPEAPVFRNPFETLNEPAPKPRRIYPAPAPAPAAPVADRKPKHSAFFLEN